MLNQDKDKILNMIDKEINSSYVNYLSKQQMKALFEGFQKDQLTDDDKKDIANHILANYLDDMHETERLIDVLLNE
ncbi:hypothetical protein LU293_09755 [Moraxella nasovis]|uniref:hypothetical protein n=1 Tax=Moraxella nasovis TaxID=2904121 RepID=UPI001F6001FE|nr:hypothetical protein [Moraxella nasovis]UNU73331.1 hypothetical protein LU293_09755 [Moraxella nasovis]